MNCFFSSCKYKHVIKNQVEYINELTLMIETLNNKIKQFEKIYGQITEKDLKNL